MLQGRPAGSPFSVYRQIDKARQLRFFTVAALVVN